MSKHHPRSRWKFPNARYTETVAALLRFLLAEPIGFHQGRRLRGGPNNMNEKRRAFIRRERNEALSKLYGIQGAKQ